MPKNRIQISNKPTKDKTKFPFLSVNIESKLVANTLSLLELLFHEPRDVYGARIRISPEQKKRNKRNVFLFGLSLFIISFLITYLQRGSNGFFTATTTTFEKVIIAILIALAITAIFLLLIYYLIDCKENAARMLINRTEIENIQTNSNDIFEDSIQMSYRYLDQYYSQTHDHAKRCFHVTIAIAICGAVLIALGIVFMILQRMEPSYLTCASGVIIEFIASITFYLYNKTTTSMSRYHNKLVLSYNVSLALKVADSLPESEETEVKKAIIQELIKDLNEYSIKTDPTEGK